MTRKIKKRDNRSKMPIYIPNQPTESWYWVDPALTRLEKNKEHKFQMKLALKNQ